MRTSCTKQSPEFGKNACFQIEITTVQILLDHTRQPAE